MTTIQELFRPVLGLPCWLVTKVHGSIVTMQFGRPELVIGSLNVRSTLLVGVPDLPQRMVRVEGDWLLTVYLCEWTLAHGDVELAHCESDDLVMNRALRVLNGQELSAVRVAPTGGSTEFVFDLGCVLTCRPAAPGVYGDGPSEMWWLSDDVTVVTVRDDATWCSLSTTADRASADWLPLAGHTD